MARYLFVDLGSTFTKLTLIDINNLEVLATTTSYTTVNDDVTKGFLKGKKLLEKKLGEHLNYKKALACSSAKGGLKMAAIGLVKELTTEAAKRVCLGSGAKVELVYSGILTNSDLKQLKESDIDIILLAGGIDSGDKKTVIANSEILSLNNLNIPIVYAGNAKAVDEVSKNFKNHNVTYYIADNVMPKLNKLNIDSAKKLIEQIFIERIVESKGLDKLEKYLNAPIIPTPSAVLKAMSLLKNKEPVLLIDIGGATTDIYSVGYGYPKKPNIALIGLEEPYLKRTVEGDLGMRYSVKGVLNNLSTYEKNMLNEKFDLVKEVNKRAFDVFYLPEKKEDFLVDKHLAKLCADTAFSRHVGVLKEAYTHNGPVYYQTGKDLTDTKYLIGTGGVIVNSLKKEEILKSLLKNINKPNELRPTNPKIIIDRKYLLSSIGLLSIVDQDKALKLMEKEIFNKRNGE